MGSNQAAVSFLTKLAGAAFTLGAGATVVNSALYTVERGQRAVVFDRFRGLKEDTVGEGTHFLIPWLQKPYIFDIRARPHTFSSVSGTKDLLMVNLTLRVLSRPEVSRLPQIFEKRGLEYHETVLPLLKEVVNAVVAQFKADQLLTERPRVSELVRENLIKRARDFNIELDDVAITHLSCGAEFSRAVEQKLVAQQEAERWSKFVAALSEQEKRAAVIRAQGEWLISEATEV